MSRYPSGHGHWPGHPSVTPSSHQYPPSDPHSVHGHTAPAYSYPPGDANPTYYAQSNAAYGINASRIPGLGGTGSPDPIADDQQGYNPWLPASGTYIGVSRPVEQRNRAPAAPLPPPPPPPSQAMQNSKPARNQELLEEGELMDDFDDLYEPQEAMPTAASSLPKKPRSLAEPDKSGLGTHASESTGEDDIFYGAKPSNSIPDANNNHSRPAAREKSGSYSPHLSPREVDLAAATSREASDAEAARNAKPTTSVLASALPPETSHAPGAARPAKPAKPTKPAKRTRTDTRKGDSRSMKPPPATTEPQFKTITEARKEAQKAILKLLPAGVKFQTYIDEGFDEEVVRSLFTDLNLVQPPRATPPQQEPPKPQPTQPTAEKPKVEERKDRIARLLAAQAAKAAAAKREQAAVAAAATTTATPPAVTPPTATPSTAAPSTAAPSTAAPSTAAPSMVSATSAPSAPSIPTGPKAATSAPATAPRAPAALRSAPTGPAIARAPSAPAALRKVAEASALDKTKAKLEKELLLKQKMEALLKTRQARAQPAAPAAPPLVPSPAIQKQADGASSSRPRNNQESMPNDAPAVTGVLASHLPNTDTSGPSGSIPGLSLATGSLQKSATQPSRKRPVAADFVDYPSSAGPSKRPFGQSRQDSFVIDISDESDEDVDMDVDSAGGNSPSDSRLGASSRMGPSIGDFPPLSDSPRGPHLSRSNSSAAPTKLTALNGEITSLQRKIAELEARKGKKVHSGSQTPDVTNGTPPESNGFTDNAQDRPAEPLQANFQEQPKEPPKEQPKDQPKDQSSEKSQEKPKGPILNVNALAAKRAASLSLLEKTGLISSQPVVGPASQGLPKRPDLPKPSYGQLTAESTPLPLGLPKKPEAPMPHLGSTLDRRTRIVSYHLPKVEATLREKQAKLKLLEQKAAQLRIDIEKESEEKARLAEEMHQLDIVEPTETSIVSRKATTTQAGSDDRATFSQPPTDIQAEVSAQLAAENVAQQQKLPSGPPDVTTQDQSESSHQIEATPAAGTPTPLGNSSADQPGDERPGRHNLQPSPQEEKEEEKTKNREQRKQEREQSKAAKLARKAQEREQWQKVREERAEEREKKRRDRAEERERRKRAWAEAQQLREKREQSQLKLPSFFKPVPSPPTEQTEEAPIPQPMELDVASASASSKPSPKAPQEDVEMEAASSSPESEELDEGEIDEREIDEGEIDEEEEAVEPQPRPDQLQPPREPSNGADSQPLSRAKNGPTEPPPQTAVSTAVSAAEDNAIEVIDDESDGSPLPEFISDGVHQNDDREAQGAVSGEVLLAGPGPGPSPAPDPTSSLATTGSGPTPAQASALASAPALATDVISNHALVSPQAQLSIRYESPLKYFRSYRYHPQYSQTVAGGLKSLTYSNKINPKHTLCPNELLGSRQCLDEDCRWQHFSTMYPRDDEILMDLGRADDFEEGDEKNGYIGGLRDILAGIRNSGVRDFDTIGYSIIDYRRQFLGDESRVLTRLHNVDV